MREPGRWSLVGIVLLVTLTAVASYAAAPASPVDRPYVVSAVPIGAGTLDDGRHVVIYLAELSDGARMVVFFVPHNEREQWGIGAFLPPEPKCGDVPGVSPSMSSPG